MATRKRGGGGSRGYERTDRLGELLREIVAETLEQIDDERLELVTVTSVDVDRELERARVYYTTISLSGEESRAGEIAAALDEHRGRVRRAIGNQARVRRVPDVSFLPDDAHASAMRIEQILHDLHETADTDTADTDTADTDRADTDTDAGDDGPQA